MGHTPEVWRGHLDVPGLKKSKLGLQGGQCSGWQDLMQMEPADLHLTGLGCTFPGTQRTGRVATCPSDQGRTAFPPSSWGTSAGAMWCSHLCACCAPLSEIWPQTPYISVRLVNWPQATLDFAWVIWLFGWETQDQLCVE